MLNLVIRIVFYIYKVVFEDLLQPEDSYRIKLRKVCLAVTPLASISVFGLNMYILAHHNTTPRVIMHILAGLSMSISWMVSWAVCRYTKRAGDNLMNAMLGTSIIGVIVILFVTQDLPYQPTFIAYIMAAIMIDTNLKWFFIFLSAMGYLIIAYNDTFVKAGYAPILLFPGSDFFTLTEFLYAQGLSVVSCVACVLLNIGQQKEHTRSLERVELLLESAEAAVEMAQGIADKLLVYDTEGARLLLKEHKARGKVDRRLLKKYKQMTKNLDKYRPHLPNYIFEEDINDVAEPSSQSRRGSLAAPKNPPQRPPRLSASNAVKQAQRAQAITAAAQLLQRTVEGKLRSFFHQWLRAHEHIKNPIPVHIPPQSPPRTPPQNPLQPAQQEHHPPQNPAILSLLLATPVKKVSCAWGHMHFKGPDNDMSRFVVLVYDKAKELHAGVHSFMGDTVSVTWNVVRRTGNCEMKALSFFVQLRDDPGDTESCGAVSSGEGLFQMAGGMLQAPLLHVEWYSRLQALAALGASHNAVLTCRRTYEQAQFTIKARCVDLMLMGTEIIDVFEVLQERPAAKGKEEWMYVLQGQGTAGPALCDDCVSRAVKMCRDVHFLEALMLLEECPPSERSEMTQRLQDKVQRCVGSNLALSDFMIGD